MSTTPPPGPYDNADRPDGPPPDQPGADPFAQPPAGHQPPQAPPAGSPAGEQPAYPPMPPPPPLQYETPGAAAAQVTPPPPLVTAVRLMYVGAALSAAQAVVFLLIGLAQADSLRDEIADDSPELSADQVDTLVAWGTALPVIIGLISVGLWIWMAVMNRKGRSWARVVATVLGGLNIVLTLIELIRNTGIGTIVNLISIALAAAILWLLYRPESSAYYAAMSGPPR